MKTKRYYHVLFLSIAMLTFFSAAGYAQENLQINTIFKKYGKRMGTTMVILTGETLKKYKLDSYQSITLKYDKQVSELVQQSLETDKKQARKMKEVISGGIITSGYYQLPEEKQHINRYILFKISDDGTATLIYMEGSLESEELINKLFIKQKQ